MTVPEQNGKDPVWFLLQVAEDMRPMHGLEFCHSWAACLKMKLWPYGNRVHCLPEGTNWWFLPWLSHCSPAQRLSGEALSFLLDQGRKLPEGLSHLLQETCSAWYKTTGWELIPPGTNGNFDVHNSGLECHWPVMAKHKEGKSERSLLPVLDCLCTWGRPPCLGSSWTLRAMNQGLLHNNSSSNCAFSFLNLHDTNQNNFDCFTVVNGY